MYVMQRNKIAYSFVSTHQLSEQEVVYNILPELCLRILLINTNLSEGGLLLGDQMLESRA